MANEMLLFSESRWKGEKDNYTSHKLNYLSLFTKFPSS